MTHFHFETPLASETIEFYSKYFGFREIKKLGKTHVLKNEQNFILAVDEGEAWGGLKNNSHLGFTLSTKGQVESLHQELGKNPLTVSSPLQVPSERAMHFYCSDPSGNRIEVGWYQF